MLRISKLTDYGIVCLAHFARNPTVPVFSAREVSDAVGVPLPTVSKLFRVLMRSGLLESRRGVGGGYALCEPPDQIDVAKIIAALEGPVAVTECSDPDSSTCGTEHTCPLRDHWPHINLAVRTALASVSLADLIVPLPNVRLQLPLAPEQDNEAFSLGSES